MRSVDASTSTLDALRQLGVHLIIDDFGTGYSSLARLKKLPVTALKIDRSFVDGLGRDSSDLSIVDAIINMADSLALGVIAEGVETAEQLEILQSLGARMGQGYLWSRALPASGLATWLQGGAPARGARRGPRPAERPAPLSGSGIRPAAATAVRSRPQGPRQLECHLGRVRIPAPSGAMMPHE